MAKVEISKGVISCLVKDQGDLKLDQGEQSKTEPGVFWIWRRSRKGYKSTRVEKHPLFIWSQWVETNPSEMYV